MNIIKYKKQEKNIKKIVISRYNILLIIVFSLVVTFLINFANVQLTHYEFYATKLSDTQKEVIEGFSSPRGEIYDRNNKLLVGNKAVQNIVYRNAISKKKSFEVAEKLAAFINIEPILKEQDYLDYFLAHDMIFNDSEYQKNLYTEEEKELLKKNKLTYGGLYLEISSRVDKKEIENLKNTTDLKIIKIFTILNSGNSSDYKVIKNSNVSNEEIAYIMENQKELEGLSIEVDWQRYYPYGDTLKGVLGNVSSHETGLPLEKKDFYLEQGYSLTSRVGISGLEEVHEKYLRGVHAKYNIVDNNLVEVEKMVAGKDIKLAIDIDLQLEIEQIIKEEMKNSLNKNSNDHSFDTTSIIITDPKTGGIYAYGGQFLKDGEFSDYSETLSLMTVMPGSIVKPASLATAFKEGVVRPGEKILDEMLILGGVKKGSWYSPATKYIDDKQAMSWSSNVYFFKNAFKIAGRDYYYNTTMPYSLDAFNKYRSMFEGFGLGAKTGIDLPKETLGYRADAEYLEQYPGVLLDFVIGQLDSYTPVQIAQYINTIANNGNRVAPSFLMAVYEKTDIPLTKLILQKEGTVLNKVDLSDDQIKRIQEDMRATSLGYDGSQVNRNSMGLEFEPASKTGTSETFKNGESTVSSTYMGYAPYSNPTMSISVTAPDFVVQKTFGWNYYTPSANISKRATEAFFRKYPIARKN